MKGPNLEALKFEKKLTALSDDELKKMFYKVIEATKIKRINEENKIFQIYAKIKSTNEAINKTNEDIIKLTNKYKDANIIGISEFSVKGSKNAYILYLINMVDTFSKYENNNSYKDLNESDNYKKTYSKLQELVALKKSLEVDKKVNKEEINRRIIQELDIFLDNNEITKKEYVSFMVVAKKMRDEIQKEVYELTGNNIKIKLNSCVNFKDFFADKQKALNEKLNKNEDECRKKETDYYELNDHLQNLKYSDLSRKTMVTEVLKNTFPNIKEKELNKEKKYIKSIIYLEQRLNVNFDDIKDDFKNFIGTIEYYYELEKKLEQFPNKEEYDNLLSYIIFYLEDKKEKIEEENKKLVESNELLEKPKGLLSKIGFGKGDRESTKEANNARIDSNTKKIATISKKITDQNARKEQLKDNLQKQEEIHKQLSSIYMNKYIQKIVNIDADSFDELVKELKENNYEIFNDLKFVSKNIDKYQAINKKNRDDYMNSIKELENNSMDITDNDQKYSTPINKILVKKHEGNN